jgi:hypothetical protein
MPKEQNNNGAGKTAPSVNEDYKAAIVADFLGVHPKYFIYRGDSIMINIGLMALEKAEFRGFKPQLESMGIK